MDAFGQALLLVATVYGLVEFVKRLLPTLNGQVLQAISFAIAIGVTYLVRASDWGDEQIVFGKSLASITWASALLVGIVLGCAAQTLHELIGKDGTIRNIGENSPG